MSTNTTGIFKIHKRAGERKTCRLIRKADEIPQFLLDSGTVRVNDDGSITMIAVEGPATRKIPFFLAWEKTDKLEGGYGSWPKDNGWDTLDVTADGRCFDKAADDAAMPRYTACKLVLPLPHYFSDKQAVSIRNMVCFVQTSWGEVRTSRIPETGCEAVLVEYEDGGVNILTLSEPSAADYFVVGEDGEDAGKLVDLIRQEG